MQYADRGLQYGRTEVYNTERRLVWREGPACPNFTVMQTGRKFWQPVAFHLYHRCPVAVCSCVSQSPGKLGVYARLIQHVPTVSLYFRGSLTSPSGSLVALTAAWTSHSLTAGHLAGHCGLPLLEDEVTGTSESCAYEQGQRSVAFASCRTPAQQV